MRLIAVATALALLCPPVRAAELDLALVLAVDVSSSMDEDELRLQRAGYVAAIADPGFADAVAAGPTGRIALTYVEWAGPGAQRVTVPWRVIDGAAAAGAFATALSEAPPLGGNDTSISEALRFAAGLFDSAPGAAARRVIDISGDGPNTAGPNVLPARNAVLLRGITINGLPLLLAGPAPGGGEADDLVAYYRDCVTGGDGAFVLPVTGRDELAAAIRRKLRTEIVARAPVPQVVRAAAADCTMGQKDFYE